MSAKAERLRGENGSRRRSVYMPDNLYASLAEISYENDLSVNAQIVTALKEWVGMYKDEK